MWCRKTTPCICFKVWLNFTQNSLQLIQKRCLESPDVDQQEISHFSNLSLLHQLPVNIKCHILSYKALKGLNPSYLRKSIVFFHLNRLFHFHTAGLLEFSKVEWEAEPSVVTLLSSGSSSKLEFSTFEMTSSFYLGKLESSCTYVSLFVCLLGRDHWPCLYVFVGLSFLLFPNFSNQIPDRICRQNNDINTLDLRWDSLSLMTF